MATVYHAHSAPIAPALGRHRRARPISRPGDTGRWPRHRPRLLPLVDIAALVLMVIGLAIGHVAGPTNLGPAQIKGLHRPVPVANLAPVPVTPIPVIPTPGPQPAPPAVVEG